MTDRFVRAEDADAQSLRRIVLFGRNVASYKFALSKSLLELGGSAEDLCLPRGARRALQSAHLRPPEGL